MYTDFNIQFSSLHTHFEFEIAQIITCYAAI